jgi:hypothetical protein
MCVRFATTPPSKTLADLKCETTESSGHCVHFIKPDFMPEAVYAYAPRYTMMFNDLGVTCLSNTLVSNVRDGEFLLKFAQVSTDFGVFFDYVLANVSNSRVLPL